MLLTTETFHLCIGTRDLYELCIVVYFQLGLSVGGVDVSKTLFNLTLEV
jgi:hypothetical protein